MFANRPSFVLGMTWLPKEGGDAGTAPAAQPLHWGLPVSPHAHRDPSARHEQGRRSRNPAGLEPPTRACIGGCGGAEDEEEEGAAEHVHVTALTQGLLHCGRRHYPPPRRRASPGLPGHCASREQPLATATDPSRGSLGRTGTRAPEGTCAGCAPPCQSVQSPTHRTRAGLKSLQTFCRDNQGLSHISPASVSPSGC